MTMKQTTGPGGRFKVAILGGGGIAETHAAILKQTPGAHLAAICDSAPGKAEAFAAKLVVPEAYTSLREMIECSKPEVVHIATPPEAHASNAVECLDSGVSVFVEKPFCVSSAESREIAAAAARSGRAVGVNHNLTFHPSILRMIEAIREGKLGSLEHTAVCYNMPMPLGGPYSHWLFRGTQNLIFELAPHPLSLIERLMGRVLSARTLPSGEMNLPSGVRFFHTWQIAMECERGTASLYLSVGGGFLDTSVRVEAEDGVAQVDLRRDTFRLSEKSHLMRPNDDLRDCLRSAKALARDGFRNYKDYILSSIGKPAPYPASYAAMSGSIRAFYAALSSGAAPPAGLTQGIAVVQACEAAVAPVLEMSLVNQTI